jgi:hypothetical protein
MSQPALFAPEAPTVPPGPVRSRKQYARMDALITCPVIESELMEIFRAAE